MASLCSLCDQMNMELENPPADDMDFQTDAGKVNSLRQELQLLASSRTVTVITASRTGATGYGVPVVVVGVVGYGYIWWKGWKLSDMLFATRHSLSDARTTVAKQLEQVHSSLTTLPSSSFSPALELPRIRPTSKTGSLLPTVPALESPSPSTSNQTPKLQGMSNMINTPDPAASNGSHVAKEPYSSGPLNSERSGWKLPGLNASLLMRTRSSTNGFR